MMATVHIEYHISSGVLPFVCSRLQETDRILMGKRYLLDLLLPHACGLSAGLPVMCFVSLKCYKLTLQAIQFCIHNIL